MQVPLTRMLYMRISRWEKRSGLLVALHEVKKLWAGWSDPWSPRLSREMCNAHTAMSRKQKHRLHIYTISAPCPPKCGAGQTTESSTWHRDTCRSRFKLFEVALNLPQEPGYKGSLQLWSRSSCSLHRASSLKADLREPPPHTWLSI